MTKQALITVSIFGIALAASAADQTHEEGWALVKQISGVAIYSRPHPESHLKEFKAIGEIDASSPTVHKVIDDVEAYTSFMPYTAECRVIKKQDDSILTYQRIAPGIVSDRDYTLRIKQKSWPVENGLAYVNRWEQANEDGPAAKPGVFRVTKCEGSWLLEPTGDGKTQATYSVFTDSGINAPAFLANTISETGISKVFAAVRKQVTQPKYQSR